MVFNNTKLLHAIQINVSLTQKIVHKKAMNLKFKNLNIFCD